MRYMPAFIFCFALIVCFATNSVAQKNGETIEVVTKKAIVNGTMKKDGNRFIYIAAPGQDTVKIRSYYEDLIKKSGKSYLFGFETATTPEPDKPKGRVTKEQKDLQENRVITVAPVSIPAAVNKPVTGNGASGSSCMNNQIVFGYPHYTKDAKEFSWTVPENVNHIKIEAWSGGGNGYDTAYYYKNAKYGWLFTNVKGGGGGGGAYGNASIPVKTGDRILVVIPPGGGGKSLQVKVNDNTNIFYLNNGADGTAGGTNGDGLGGTSGGAYGIFKNSFYFIDGEDGTPALIEKDDDVLPVEGDGAFNVGNSGRSSHTYALGKGGNAAYLTNGGRGGIFTEVWTKSRAGSNGKFPGGGGGGGLYTIHAGNDEAAPIAQNPGRGAPGIVIIHY